LQEQERNGEMLVAHLNWETPQNTGWDMNTGPPTWVLMNMHKMVYNADGRIIWA